jgi:hypothetical protein
MGGTDAFLAEGTIGAKMARKQALRKPRRSAASQASI